MTISTRHRLGRPRACILAAAACVVPALGLASLQPVDPYADPTPAPARPPAAPAAETPPDTGAHAANDQHELDGVDTDALLRRSEELLEEARVVLRTGREFVGLYIAQDDRILTLRVRGEDMKIDLADSIEFEILGPVVESFRALRAATPNDDTAGRLHLVRWLRDRGAYYTALDEVESVLALEPFNNQATEIAVWLREQIRLRRSAADSARGSGESDEAERPDLPRRRINDFPVLTPEEINLLRVYEVDLSDPPRLHVPHNVVEEFISLYRDSEVIPRSPEGREALLRRDSRTVLDLMFRAQARPLYGEVRVLEDPKAFKVFREQIHKTWLVGSNSSCASNSCHGGQEAGRLWLNNNRANSDATVYTNFLILDRFRLRDGTPLINYDEPASSPLLQMALPRERSARPHPDVGRTAGRRGWRPFFRDEDDMRYRRAVEWIRSMYRPRPDYPIEYTPPVPRSVLREEQLPEPGER